ncbi:fam-a protein [Plasmodium vinckei brucechwatti]|uniref:Fam-a protein n=1 Tax=Plasmodium vinckei brucechwatti TaxID=119398 RepID=A0A6V7SSQ8_PLAVN|nr:fam-a protein [Plasmodium vinckei brucechwatti]
MNEDVTKLEYYAELAKNNESGRRNSNTSTGSCEKEEEEDPINKYVIKVNFQIDDPNKYNRIINKLWDPDYLDSSNHPPKIVRVYNPSLVMIQRRYKDPMYDRQKYFYAFVKKTQVSKDKTIIAMTSANINDHNPSKKTYKNKIIENANLFTIDIDSEDDIRNGKIQKTYVNIAGYLIEKKDNHVDVTYVESIDGNNPF